MSPHAAQQHAPIVVFDGGCVLCNGTVQWVLRHERDNAIRFAATQSDAGARLLKQSGFDPSAPQTFLLIENDRVLTRSDAALALVARMRAPWRWLRSLRFIPRRLRDAIYDWIAARRVRLFGRSEICLRAPNADPARFLS
jgi:predicted DCC family thiol-disulfide oxidoreductase YuxK